MQRHSTLLKHLNAFIDLAWLPPSPFVYLLDSKKPAVKPQTEAAVQSAQLKMIFIGIIIIRGGFINVTLESFKDITEILVSVLQSITVQKNVYQTCRIII